MRYDGGPDSTLAGDPAGGGHAVGHQRQEEREDTGGREAFWEYRSNNAKDEIPVDYVPGPINTSGVTLTEELRQLTELLAKNAHAHWARQRLADGWRYGPERNDARKEHPDLVPYEAPTEAEKDYDRITAMETLKTIIALGYRIERSP